jgi:WD40 repeat protein
VKKRLSALMVATLGMGASPALAELACSVAPPTHHLVLAQSLSAGDSEVRGVALSPDETLLLAGSNDASVRVWRLADGKLVMRSTPMDGPVWSVAFTGDGRRVLASGPMGPGEGVYSTNLWDVETGAKIAGRSGGDLGLATDNSTLIATALPQGSHEMGLIDLIDGRVAARWTPRFYENAWAYAHGPGGPMVMTSNDDGSARFADARGERPLDTHPKRLGPAKVALSADGRVGYSQHAAWDAETGRKLYDVPLGRGYSAVQNPIFSPDSRILLVERLNSKDGDDVLAMNARSGAPIARICGAAITEQAVSGDGRRYVANTQTGSTVWDVETGAVVARLNTERFEVWDFALSRDGRVLVTGSIDGVVRVWRIEPGDGPVPSIPAKRYNSH